MSCFVDTMGVLVAVGGDMEGGAEVAIVLFIFFLETLTSKLLICFSKILFPLYNLTLVS